MYLAVIQEEHLSMTLNVMAHLKQRYNTLFTFGPTYTDTNIDLFNYNKSWINIYIDVEEYVPANAPAQHGKPVDIRAFVDSDHVGKKKTQLFCTGHLIRLNNELIAWFGKQ